MSSIATSQPKKVVVHLLGSAVSSYYRLVSTQYAQSCVAAASDDETLALYDHKFAVVWPDGGENSGTSWSFPEAIDDASLQAAERISQADGLARLAGMASQIDVMVPHMFCFPGMTSYRALFDLLNVPFVGCPADAMALSTDKAKSRGVVQAAGVRVAEGEVLRQGQNETPTILPPFVLKPTCEDNSMGISVVRSMDEFPSALAAAFEFGDEILVEEFVPLGREIRCAVLEDEFGQPSRVLPCLEYFLTDEHPIRTPNDKITTDAKGQPTGLASGGRKCPADVDDNLMAKLSDAAIKSHRALGCRDYSLYDFRISPDNEVYFLEACLYCSFAPRSVIVSMANATEDPSITHPKLLHTFLDRAAGRRVDPSLNDAQMFGMKANTKKPSETKPAVVVG